MRQFFKLIFFLSTKISTRLLIGLLTTLYSEKVVAENTKSLFFISGKLTITQISDGDSLRSGKLKIRLFGIDAPEKKQKCATADGEQWDCGIAAQKALQHLVESVPQISCNLMDVDRYARLVMRCYAGKTDVAEALVKAGLALAYRQYSKLYINDENNARMAGVGMWDGSFTEPWTWRRTR
tara:strand:+ start:90 stop:632 length:543 start_codon:yes stop_codon:yes gene_type:complete